MTSITYLNGSFSRNEAVRLCRQNARECQRAAFASTNHDIRVRYWHLAKLWHEMAREAERKANGTSSFDDGGAVIIPMQFPKRSKSRSEQTSQA
jgi:hypothetical protein